MRVLAGVAVGLAVGAVGVLLAPERAEARLSTRVMRKWKGVADSVVVHGVVHTHPVSAWGKNPCLIVSIAGGGKNHVGYVPTGGVLPNAGDKVSVGSDGYVTVQD
jgi:hypothetical protein